MIFAVLCNLSLVARFVCNMCIDWSVGIPSIQLYLYMHILIVLLYCTLHHCVGLLLFVLFVLFKYNGGLYIYTLYIHIYKCIYLVVLVCSI